MNELLNSVKINLRYFQLLSETGDIKMSVKTINIPIDLLIEMLKQLNDEDKNEIFEKAFIDVDTEPLTLSDKKSIAVAEKEYEKGETIPWPNGE